MSETPFTDLLKMWDEQKLANEIKTQDNRATETPIWIVQERKRIYGLEEDWRQGYVWLNEDAEEADAETAAALEKTVLFGEDPEGWEKVGYVDIWEFVTACATEAGCEAFIKADKHNHGELRIYAAGSYRNEEWKLIIGLLKQVDKK